MSASIADPDHDPDLPHAGGYLWNWFWQIHRGRQAGFSGPLPISSTEMASWASLHRHDVIPQEWDVICKMDMAFMRSFYTKETPQKPDETTPVVSARPVSRGLVRALFGRQK